MVDILTGSVLISCILLEWRGSFFILFGFLGVSGDKDCLIRFCLALRGLVDQGGMVDVFLPQCEVGVLWSG